MVVFTYFSLAKNNKYYKNISTPLNNIREERNREEAIKETIKEII
jgi:hypothetical protein